MGVRTANVQDGNIGETLTGLAEVIHGRRDASPQESYTARLLTDVEDELLKKLAEEASEVIMACKDNDHDHIRYEAGDLIYHLLVTLERYGIPLDEAGALEAETAALLEGDETYACLLTVPGIGPRTAAQLAVSVDIGRFPDHDHLASYCGIAPRVRSSGTSVRSVRASRRGDARLKSLLIFSCNSLVRSSGRYGEYYRACRARGMGHGRALKAVARKRLRAIYAVMRDRVPYRE